MKKIVNKDIISVFNDTAILNKSKYYQFGWNYFGPFLLGFTKWLDDSIKKSGVKKVFFFSRDGYMMEKAFKILKSSDIKTEYVYFSRKSIKQALLYKCDSFEDSLQYLSYAKFISIAKILEYYGFSEEERKKISYRYNWNLLKEYEYEHLKENSDVREIYLALHESIIRKSKEQSELLFRYLKQIDMEGECAIVDIGWHGSMQYCLQQFLLINDITANLHGFYVGIMPVVPMVGDTDGYVYNSLNTKLRKSVLCFLGVLEKLFQSLEGSTYGYEEKDGVIKPICSSYEYEGQDQFVFCITEWQNAALDFLKKSINIHLSKDDYIDLAMPLINFGKNPSLSAIELFSFFYNTDGIKEYYVSQKGLFEYKPKEFVHALSNSVWKTGFMKSVFKIPFPYYYIYSLLRK